MIKNTKSKIELTNPNYVPVIKESKTFYGGSQMWFPASQWYTKDYVLHNYGCGTIATADMFLYFALQNKALSSPETEIALGGNTQIQYDNYDSYIRLINNRYTKTKRVIAVLGLKIASVINEYSGSYGFGYQASWKFKLTYYDMLDMIEEMLLQDIPVILSIGPNTPNLWGKKGIPFYILREIDYQEENVKIPVENNSISNTPNDDLVKSVPNTKPTETKKPYYYKVAQSDVNGHYITVTGLIRDDVANRIMLRISSWGKQYYINYEEYREYVENTSGTFTSSIVQVKKN